MKKTILLIATGLFVATAFSQYQNIMISPPGASISEPSITMNPKNTDQLVAGSNLNKYYVSDDGGFTWTYETLTSPQYGVWGDPCIIVDTAGDFYFFHLSNPSSGSWIDRIVCQKFDFETHEWTDGTYMGLNGSKAQDKEWAVVDSATNSIYVTWTQFDQYGTSDPAKFSNIHFSKSTDGGLTWSEAMQINEISGNCVDSDETTEGAVPAVGPDGEIYVAWSGPAGIVFDRSLDGGATWLDEDIFINAQPGGWNYDIPGIYRANGLPVTCCDIGNSEYQGTIYVNWTDQRNGVNDTDVWLSKSIDGGNTWTDALRINDDPPGKQQFFTWMTIDQTNGEIIIVFYDRRNYDDRNTDVYIARSSDGGETFENIKISESPFLPNNSVFFGDYTNITAHDGKVRPIWARADGTSMSIWVAIVDVSTDIAVSREQMPFNLEQNYPNPFSESTYISYKIRRPSVVTLSVFDVFGRQVAVLINNRNIEAGKYIEQFNARNYKIPSGVYYFTLQIDNVVEKQKMILVD
ncbi:MAG: T9SS type A sorting domain-containing protein [Bacteroidetes bacterium]|nr:T9SS type A sorting domain-containing protein [Bacteroidota bacterium]MBL6942742.1 T9SS type A sorting domain-containing protein [Bacteroidales bacterium]